MRVTVFEERRERVFWVVALKERKKKLRKRGRTDSESSLVSGEGIFHASVFSSMLLA